jgi:hypothetical protein
MLRDREPISSLEIEPRARVEGHVLRRRVPELEKGVTHAIAAFC